MFSALAKAVGQLSDPKARGVLWKSMGLSIIVFIGLWWAIGYFLASTALVGWLWLDTIFDVLGWIATLLVTILLFPSVMSGLIGVLLEDVAVSVEARHYPLLPAVKGISVVDIATTTLRFMAVMIILNLLLLPFLLLPPVFPFVFYSVNGYLLSREYFELVAVRRVASAEAREIRKAHRGALFLSGVVIAFLMTVPVVNLLAPIIATATMVHLFEAWRPRPELEHTVEAD